MRVRAADGENHEKLILLYAQGRSIFGSSNWTSPSANSQQEHNYFTNKPWIFTWFQSQFERKWNNTNPAGVAETEPFVPLLPDKPANVSIANGAVGVATTGQKLKWYGGPWAHVYDVYFGTSPTPPLFAANQTLGPSETTSQNQSFTLPALTGGTTYYWKIVAKTAAGLSKTGDTWSFTTAGSPPPPPPPPPGATTLVLWASNTLSSNIHGTWMPVTDTAASGGSALSNTNAGAAKISPALVDPANYFEQTFTAYHGTAYHLWVRLRAGSNSLGNDSVHVQFSGSIDSFGSPHWRIGTTSSAEVVLQGGSSDPSVSGWGWADDGWDAAGVPIYFAADGAQTVRVQQREDGAIVDEIVLSPDTYLNASPGARDNDTTVLAVNDRSGSPPPPPPPPQPDVVLWTANVPAANMTGNWQPVSDASAAGGAALWNADAAQPKVAPALAAPSNYFEMTFTAAAGAPYHLWVRMRAAERRAVQRFDPRAVQRFGGRRRRTRNADGTSNSAEVVLQAGANGPADHGWGWADNGWGAPGVNIYFATSGTHTIRVQQREDGAIVDQIVLSPGAYLNAAPGGRRDDATIISP